MTLAFPEIWRRLNETDETVTIEAKASSQLGTSILETVSAFSNEPNQGGGYLLLGVGMAKNSLFPSYEITGVSNPDKLQADLATQCREMFNRPVRPQISVEVGAINNAAYRDINRLDTLVASGHLRKLRDHGLLEQKGKAAGTFYVPTQRLLRPLTLSATGDAPESALALTGEEQGLASAPVAQSHQLASALGSESVERPNAVPSLPPSIFEMLPSELAAEVRQLGQRGSVGELRQLIRKLCQWKTLGAEEIAQVLSRQKVYVLRTYLGPMLRDKELEYTHPDNPTHPLQAYRTPQQGTTT